MFDFSIVATLIAVFVVAILFYILIKVLMKDEDSTDSDKYWDVQPTCKPAVVPNTNVDPASGQKLDPAEVKEIMDIIKNQPEELIAPPVLSSEYNPIIQPPPEEKAVAKSKKKTPAKKTPAKKTTTRKKVKKANS